MRFEQLPGRFGDCSVAFGPAVIPIIAIAATAIGTGVTIAGQQAAASAQSKAASYQAQVAQNQQQIASEQAKQASAAGQQQAYNQGMKTRAIVGSEMAAQGASNVDVNTGSNVDVRSSAAALGQLDALTIRSNAARQAYGFETQATSYGAQAGLEKQQASGAATAGNLAATGSLLSGASSVARQYQGFLQSGALPGGSSGGGGGAVGGNSVFF
jgi:hypothetical protein